MIAVIMAGGSGTRFWPQSRKHYPKQFLQIAGEKSMLQLTVDRLLPLIPINDIYIVTAAEQCDLVRQHLPTLPPENIICEPFGMNTAPCIALSVEYLKTRYRDDTAMIVLPADHVIRKKDSFIDTLQSAEKAADSGALITFGIVPDYPATGYGYIEAGPELAHKLYAVKRFKEKPDLDTAKDFLRQGSFFWNSGMFCWTISSITHAFERYLPEVAGICKKISVVWQNQGFDADIAELYRHMPRIPIDIGIMEKAESAAVIPVDLGWSDVGSFKALAEISPKDAQGNYSPAPFLALDARNNYIHSKKFVALIGVDNLCLIETEDAILITPKDRSEEVKKVVELLHQEGQDDLT